MIIMFHMFYTCITLVRNLGSLLDKTVDLWRRQSCFADAFCFLRLVYKIHRSHVKWLLTSSTFFIKGHPWFNFKADVESREQKSCKIINPKFSKGYLLFYRKYKKSHCVLKVILLILRDPNVIFQSLLI